MSQQLIGRAVVKAAGDRVEAHERRFTGVVSRDELDSLIGMLRRIHEAGAD